MLPRRAGQLRIVVSHGPVVPVPTAVRLPVADIVQRSRQAEASGFSGVAFIDHLDAPGLSDETIWEAMGVATWVAAKTDRLRIGHPMRCDAFRHPAALAKQAVTLSEASDGRFELGLGSGSWPAEFTRFDVGQDDPVARVEQLERHLGPWPTRAMKEPVPECTPRSRAAASTSRTRATTRCSQRHGPSGNAPTPNSNNAGAVFAESAGAQPESEQSSAPRSYYRLSNAETTENTSLGRGMARRSADNSRFPSIGYR